MRRATGHEAGFAIPTAVLLTVFVTLVLGVVVANQIAQSAGSRRSTARTGSLDIAGGAVQAIQQALVTRRNADVTGTSQRDGFTIAPADITTAAGLVGGTVVANTATAFQTVDTAYGGMANTVRLPADDDGSTPMWQVLQARQPTGASPYLTLYIRAWRQVGTNASDAAVVRARLKPGSMADYQLVSDVPIQLDANVRINGRVHSNGFTDEENQPPLSNSMLRVWSTGTVACSASAGIQPVVSTANGYVSLPGGSGCDIQENSNQFVSLDSARDSVARMRTRCGTDVRCFTGAATPTAVATAQITANSVIVNYPGSGSTTVPISAAGVSSLIFDRSVRVSGTTAHRLTIAAWSTTGGATGRDAPSIIVSGNVGRSAPSDTQPRALGLLAENDIVIDPTSNPTRIEAALIASAGGVRLPWQFRTSTRVETPANYYPPQRGNLTIIGSVASHANIALRWSWGTDWIGYSSRTYEWDPWLGTYAPPYWPTTNGWELVDQGDANADCFGAGTNKAAASCR